MKIIFIRGLPGTGKTTIAKQLARKFNARYLNIDEFKIKAKTGDFKKDCLYAYKMTLDSLSLLRKDKNINYIIMEEIFYNKKFVNDLIKFTKDNHFLSYWFQVKRSLRDLLKVESLRKRKIKNIKNDFHYLQKGIDSIKIKDEKVIKNLVISSTVKKIISFVNNFKLS